MKLLSKLTLFITLSKLVIVLLFVLILPSLIESIASQYTNTYLREQQKKVLDVVKKNGIDFYLQGEKSFGSYTMLKEEYIALEPSNAALNLDTIETSQRIVEEDTLSYRILSYTFKSDKRTFLLEIGKKTSAISQYNRPLQKIALYVLTGLVVLTMLIDLVFTHFQLKPLGKIIKTKLINQNFPFTEHSPPIKTSTSDFKYLDNALISLMDQINDAFEKEREFTANASHELMTPISILKSKIENLMLHDDVNEVVQERLIEMMRTLNRLKKIVHSLLLISRIENDQFVKLDKVVMKELFEEVVEEIGHRFEDKEIQCFLQLEHDVTIVNANRDLLFQLVANFVNNAIRYNKYQGTIIISDDLAKDGSYLVNIKDTGIGISKDDVPLIFNRFRKANLNAGAGYGLGLSIVKSIATYHELEIEVASEVGEGTCFTIIFPEEKVRVKKGELAV